MKIKGARLYVYCWLLIRGSLFIDKISNLLSSARPFFFQYRLTTSDLLAAAVRRAVTQFTATKQGAWGAAAWHAPTQRATGAFSACGRHQCDYLYKSMKLLKD